MSYVLTRRTWTFTEIRVENCAMTELTHSTKFDQRASQATGLLCRAVKTRETSSASFLVA